MWTSPHSNYNTPHTAAPVKQTSGGNNDNLYSLKASYPDTWLPREKKEHKKGPAQMRNTPGKLHGLSLFISAWLPESE